MYTENDISLIIPYLQRKASGIERERVETLLRESAEFKEAFEFESEIYFAVEMDVLDDMNSKINVSADKYKQTKKNKTIKAGLAVLAIGALVTGIAVFVFNDDKRDSIKKEDVVITSNVKANLNVSETSQELKDTSKTEIENKESIAAVSLETVALDEETEEVEKLITPITALENSNIDSIIPEYIVDENLTQVNIDTFGETVTPEVIEQPETVLDKIEISCKKPTIRVSTVASDFGKSNGEIQVKSNSVLSFRIKSADVMNTSSGIFYDLEDGKYQLIAYDSVNCEYDMGFYTVDLNECVNKKSYVFKRSLEGTWVIPATSFPVAKIQVLSSKVDFLLETSGNDDIVWSGNLPNGQAAEEDLYIINVTTTNLKKCKYSVALKN